MQRAKCKWCGATFERDHLSPSKDHYCSLSHSVKAQHAKKVLGPRVKHNEHGTRARYLRGCRCKMCKATSGPCRCNFCLTANAVYSRELRKKSKYLNMIAELRKVEEFTRRAS